jgi:hypothetical protein
MIIEEELHELRLRYQQLEKKYEKLINTSLNLINYKNTEIPEKLKTNPVIIGIQDLLRICKMLSFEHYLEDYFPNENSSWSDTDRIIF